MSGSGIPSGALQVKNALAELKAYQAVAQTNLDVLNIATATALSSFQPLSAPGQVVANTTQLQAQQLMGLGLHIDSYSPSTGAPAAMLASNSTALSLAGTIALSSCAFTASIAIIGSAPQLSIATVTSDTPPGPGTVMAGGGLSADAVQIGAQISTGVYALKGYTGDARSVTSFTGTNGTFSVKTAPTAGVLAAGMTIGCSQCVPQLVTQSVTGYISGTTLFTSQTLSPGVGALSGGGVAGNTIILTEITTGQCLVNVSQMLGSVESPVTMTLTSVNIVNRSYLIPSFIIGTSTDGGTTWPITYFNLAVAGGLALAGAAPQAVGTATLFTAGWDACLALQAAINDGINRGLEQINIELTNAANIGFFSTPIIPKNAPPVTIWAKNPRGVTFTQYSYGYGAFYVFANKCKFQNIVLEQPYVKTNCFGSGNQGRGTAVAWYSLGVTDLEIINCEVYNFVGGLNFQAASAVLAEAVFYNGLRINGLRLTACDFPIAGIHSTDTNFGDILTNNTSTSQIALANGSCSFDGSIAPSTVSCTGSMAISTANGQAYVVGNLLYITSVSSGAFYPGGALTMAGLPSPTSILSQQSAGSTGIPGGTGVYVLSASATGPAGTFLSPIAVSCATGIFTASGFTAAPTQNTSIYIGMVMSPTDQTIFTVTGYMDKAAGRNGIYTTNYTGSTWSGVATTGTCGLLTLTPTELTGCWISGTTLNVGAVATGSLAPGCQISGSINDVSIATGTTVVQKLTNTTWEVSISQTVGSSAATGTFDAASLYLGYTISYTTSGTSVGTCIITDTTAAGGDCWAVSTAQTVASLTMIGAGVNGTYPETHALYWDGSDEAYSARSPNFTINGWLDNSCPYGPSFKLRSVNNATLNGMVSSGAIGGLIMDTCQNNIINGLVIGNMIQAFNAPGATTLLNQSIQQLGISLVNATGCQINGANIDLTNAPDNASFYRDSCNDITFPASQNALNNLVGLCNKQYSRAFCLIEFSGIAGAPIVNSVIRSPVIRDLGVASIAMCRALYAQGCHLIDPDWWTANGTVLWENDSNSSANVLRYDPAIVNVAQATQQQSELLPNNPWVANNTATFNLTYEGLPRTIGPVSYSTSSDATWLAIMAAFQAAIPGLTYTTTNRGLSDWGSNVIQELLLTFPVMGLSVISFTVTSTGDDGPGASFIFPNSNNVGYPVYGTLVQDQTSCGTGVTVSLPPLPSTTFANLGPDTQYPVGTVQYTTDQGFYYVSSSGWAPTAHNTVSYTASGTFTFTIPAGAKRLRGVLFPGAPSGANGTVATSGTAYSGGAGGSGTLGRWFDWDLTGLGGAPATVIIGAGGASPSGNGAHGNVGSLSSLSITNGKTKITITAYPSGTSAGGSTTIAASGSCASAFGAGGNASGATAGEASNSAVGGSANSSAPSTTVISYQGNVGAASPLGTAPPAGGNCDSGAPGGGAGAGMAATQAPLAGGNGGRNALNNSIASGGTTTGQPSGSGTTSIPSYPGNAGGGGANNTAGAGGAGGYGGMAAPGGGGGTGTTAGGVGGAGGSGFLSAVIEL